ncbi:MAG: hypothetical protein KDK39_12235 [Leptospiraceae bacterium]|nr:hypothetical protein [Leptospiraceae bacterium]
MLSFLVILTSACSSASPLPRAAADDCGGLQQRFESQKNSTAVRENARVFMGSLGSYSVAALSAVGETALYVSGGVLIGALVCSPVALLEGALDSDGEASSECFSAVASQAVAAFIAEDQFSLTQEWLQDTRAWRYKNYDNLHADLLESAQCNLDRQDPAGLRAAQAQLDWIQQNQAFQANMSPAARDRFLNLKMQVTDLK